MINRLLVVFVLFLFSCDPAMVYHDNIDFESKTWDVDNVPEFEFEIEDTAKLYDIKLFIRNAISYDYSNLYYNYYLEDASGKILETKQLEVLLFDEKTGKPNGSGLGDIYSHNYTVMTNYKFTETGKYKMKFKHYMRDEKLMEILSIGVRIAESHN